MTAEAYAQSNETRESLYGGDFSLSCEFSHVDINLLFPMPTAGSRDTGHYTPQGGLNHKVYCRHVRPAFWATSHAENLSEALGKTLAR